MSPLVLPLVPKDVTLLPQESTEAAVKVYIDGQADALSAWEPNVLDAEAKGAKVIVASDKLRAILDVLISSRVALKSRPETRLIQVILLTGLAGTADRIHGNRSRRG